MSRADDAVAWYSSRGPTWYDGFQKPDLVAPDSHLVSDVSTASTIYNTYPGGALLVNGKPAVKAILQYTALPVANADTLTQGAGAVNAAGAIALAAAIDPNRPVGAWWLTTGVNTWTTIGGQTLAWGQRVVWGDQIIWGTGLLGETTGNTVTWGSVSGNVTANRVVWGNLQSLNLAPTALSWANVERANNDLVAK